MATLLRWLFFLEFVLALGACSDFRQASWHCMHALSLVRFDQ